MADRLRILSDNAADRATLTVPNTAAGMGASNLKSDLKSRACRILSNTVNITLDWLIATQVGMVALPVCSLGPNSTIRVRAYADSAESVLLQDSGLQLAAPGPLLVNWDFQQQLNVNSFAENPQPVHVFLPEQAAARRVTIVIVDPDATFIDIARLVVGPFTELAYGADWGVSIGTEDLSTNTRSAAGDLRTDWGPKNGNMAFDVGWVVEYDRAQVRKIIAAGIGKWLFFSLLPNDPDPVARREYSIYGKAGGNSRGGSMTYAAFNLHSTQFNIQGF